MTNLEAAIWSRAGRQEGAEVQFLCPAHDDHHPSARWNPEKGAWYCDVCHAFPEEFHKGDHEGQLLGDDNFVSRVLGRAEIKIGQPPSLGSIIAEVCREVGVSEGRLRVPGRDSQAAQARWMVGFLAMDHNSASLTEVARYFRRDVSSISNGVRQLRERTNEDKQFWQRVTRLGERLIQIKMSKA